MDASTSEGLPGYERSGTIRWVVGSCLLIRNGLSSPQQRAGRRTEALFRMNHGLLEEHNPIGTRKDGFGARGNDVKEVDFGSPGGDS